MLRTYVDKLSDRDEKAHDEIKAQVKAVADDNRAQSQILGEVRDELGRTTTAMMATTKSVDRLVTYVDINQKAQIRLATARGEAEIDDGSIKERSIGRSGSRSPWRFSCR